MQQSTDPVDRPTHEFQAFQLGDATDTAEIISRYIVVISCATALWFATYQWIMPIWGLGYLLLSSLHITYLRRTKGPYRPGHFRIALLSSTLVAIWYGAMVVYVAGLSDGDYLFLATCGCLGLALHCLTRNAEFSASAYVDFWATVLTGGLVTAMAAWLAPSIWVSAAMVVGGLCAICYFWLCFHQIITERIRYEAASRADTQSQKMLALGQLTSGIAHDFNNLLTVISGNVELSLMDPKSPETKGYLKDAQSAAARGAELVRQLLAYARKSRLHLSLVDVDILMARLETVLSRTLPAHIQLRIGPIEPQCRIIGDAALLESALLNLVINARDAMGPTPGSVSISVRHDVTGTLVEFCVADTGPGMDPDILSRADEPFFTTKEVGAGSGLGLSMVKGFAEQSNGTLSLRNAPQGGLQATLSLPCAGTAPPPGQSDDAVITD